LLLLLSLLSHPIVKLWQVQQFFNVTQTASFLNNKAERQKSFRARRAVIVVSGIVGKGNENMKLVFNTSGTWRLM